LKKIASITIDNRAAPPVKMAMIPILVCRFSLCPASGLAISICRAAKYLLSLDTAGAHAGAGVGAGFGFGAALVYGELDNSRRTTRFLFFCNKSVRCKASSHESQFRHRRYCDLIVFQ
jgi:hypothetical protein